MSESRTEKQIRLVLEQQCAEIARWLKAKVPAGTGFVLMLADFGTPENPGNTAYVATVRREDGIRMMRELLERFEAGE